jgi:hypothetical protein
MGTSAYQLDLEKHSADSTDFEAASRRTIVAQDKTVRTVARSAVNVADLSEPRLSEANPLRTDDFSTGVGSTVSTEEKIEVLDPVFPGIIGRSAALREVLNLISEA